MPKGNSETEINENGDRSWEIRVRAPKEATRLLKLAEAEFLEGELAAAITAFREEAPSYKAPRN